MKKIIILLILLIPLNVFALDYPNLHYKNAIVYDLTAQETMYEYNSNMKTPIASLTKLMTIITAIEIVDNPNGIITYSKEINNHVSWEASKVGFKIGDKLTFNDLLYGAMLPSGADATVALAYYTSGSLESFVKEMNILAQKIGMTNSNFVNVHGLDEMNHYSTAHDLSLLLAYSLKNDTFKKVYTTKEYTLSNGKNIQSTVKKNATLHKLDISQIIGCKTGFTSGAGLAISVLMEHQNHQIIFITIGAPTNGKVPYNLTDAISLINFITNNYQDKQIVSKNTLIKTLEVEDSKIEKYEIKTNTDIIKFLPNDYDKTKINIEYEGIDKLSYKNKENDILGTIIYSYDNEVIQKETVTLNTTIEKDYSKIIKKYQKEILIISSVLIVIIIATIFIIIKRIRKKSRK